MNLSVAQKALFDQALADVKARIQEQEDDGITYTEEERQGVLREMLSGHLAALCDEVLEHSYGADL